MAFGIFVSLKHMDSLQASRLLLYRMGPVVCASPVHRVLEVIPAAPPTRIPGTDGAVSGLVNLRGQLLTVVDGRLVAPGFGSKSAAESVLVLARGGRQVGLAVDEVLDLADLPADTFGRHEGPAGVPAVLVQGVGQHGGRQVILLDTDALLAPYLG
jgi:purine-binding chemotaxis protein CheW